VQVATLEDVLIQLAGQVRLTATAESGNRFRAMLTLPEDSTSPLPAASEARVGGKVFPPRSGSLDVTGTVEVRKIVQEPVNLQWISESVLFAAESDPPAAADLTIPPDIIGQLPVQPSIPVLGTPIPPGVSGAIGLLTGTIPVFEVLDELVTATATIEARWRVLDENKVPLASFGWSSGSMTGDGSEFVPSPDQILNKAVELLLVPPFVDLVSLTPPAPVRRWIQARFRLSAQGVSTPWIDLEAPVDLSPLAIPTVLLLFFDPDFGGPALLVLPKDSQLGPDLLLNTLTHVRDVMATVRELVDFVGLFIDVVNALEPVLDSLEIAVTKADAIANLNDIDVVGTPWWAVWRNDREAEDEMASLIFLGAPGRSLQAFNDRNFNDDQGQLNINIGPEMAVTIRTLYHGETGEFVPPDAVPANRVTVATGPHGCRGFWCWAGGGHDITTFGDEFSSLRFGW
jgi:hypothetical protein